MFLKKKNVDWKSYRFLKKYVVAENLQKEFMRENCLVKSTFKWEKRIFIR